MAPTKVRASNNDDEVTGPDDEVLIMHNRLTNNEAKVALYLGISHRYKYRRMLLSDRVLYITILVNGFLKKATGVYAIAHLFKLYREQPSDAAFRDKYRVGLDTILEYFKDGDFSVPMDRETSLDNKAIALAYILVYSHDLLTDEVDASELRWNGEEFPDCVERMIADDHHSKHKNELEKPPCVLPKVPWTQDICPQIKHYPEYGEHPIEKYMRIITLAKKCAKDIFVAYYKLIYNSLRLKIAKADAQTQEQKRQVFEEHWFQGTKPLLLPTQGPVWILQRSEKKEPRTRVITERKRDIPKKLVNLELVLIPTGTNLLRTRDKVIKEFNEKFEELPTPSNPIVITRLKPGYQNVDLFVDGDEWRDDIRLFLGFTTENPNGPDKSGSGSIRRLVVIYLIDGTINAHFDNLPPEDKWELVYEVGEGELVSWNKVRERMLATSNTKTLVIGHGRIPHWSPDEDYPDYETADYQLSDGVLTPRSFSVETVQDDKEPVSVANGSDQPVTQQQAMLEDDMIPRAHNERDNGKPEFPDTPEGRKEETDFYLGFNIHDEPERLKAAESIITEVLGRTKHRGNSTIYTQKSLFPRGGVEQGELDIVHQEERLDADEDGVLPSALEQDAAASVFTGSTHTKGPPLKYARDLFEAQPTGRFLHDDKNLEFFKCPSVFPGFGNGTHGDTKLGIQGSQLTGAAWVAGRILPNALVPKTLQGLSANVTKTRMAEYYDKDQYNPIRTGGCIISDTMGSGKTIEVLLAVYYIIRYHESAMGKAKGQDKFEPHLIVAPSQQVAQVWIGEIKTYFPDVDIILAYGDAKHEQRSTKDAELNVLPAAFFSNPRNANKRSPRYSYLWDDNRNKLADKRVKLTFIITTKDTYARRVLKKGSAPEQAGPSSSTGDSAGASADGSNTQGPPAGNQMGPDDEKMFCNQLTEAGRGFGFVILDEGHHYRNDGTALYAAIKTTKFKYFVGITATTVVNGPQDLANLIGLFHKNNWDRNLSRSERNRIQKITFDEFTREQNRNVDPRLIREREGVLNPALLQEFFKRSYGNVDIKKYADFICCVEEAFILRRGPSTQLDEDKGSRNNISLKHLLPDVEKRFIYLRHLRLPEVHYQNLHLEITKKYLNGTKKKRADNDEDELFGAFIALQRDYDMLTFAVPLYQFAKKVRKYSRDITVAHIKMMRRSNWDLITFLAHLKGEDTVPFRTAADWLEFAIKGSPKLREILRLIWKTLINPLKDAEKPPSKVYITEEVPANAYLIELVLKFLHVRVETMSSDLSEDARMQLVKSFKSGDRDSVTVLIQMYQVSGAEGLSLHDHCSTVIVATPAPNLAIEEQAIHRPIRLAQQSTVKVFYLYLENSHDSYRLAQQFRKSRFDLIGRVTIDRYHDLAGIFNRFQPEVQAAHRSRLGRYLIENGQLFTDIHLIPTEEVKEVRRWIQELRGMLRKNPKPVQLPEEGEQRPLLKVCTIEEPRHAKKRRLQECANPSSKRPKTAHRNSDQTPSRALMIEPAQLATYVGKEEQFAMRTGEQWIDQVREMNLNKSANETLNLEMMDLGRLLCIPEYFICTADHVQIHAIQERIAECCFRMRKVLKTPLVSKVTPRIDYYHLQPKRREEYQYRLEKAEADIVLRYLDVTDVDGESMDTPNHIPKNKTLAIAIDELQEKCIGGERLGERFDNEGARGIDTDDGEGEDGSDDIDEEPE